ncbi:hypothetical protein WJ969_04525 [Achromobacter xylosoxidans]
MVYTLRSTTRFCTNSTMATMAIDTTDMALCSVGLPPISLTKVL